MMSIFQRIWAGIVGAVAGAALAVLVQIIGQMAIGLPIDFLIWILISLTSVGFIVAMIFGPRIIFKGSDI